MCPFATAPVGCSQAVASFSAEAAIRREVSGIRAYIGLNWVSCASLGSAERREVEQNQHEIQVVKWPEQAKHVADSSDKFKKKESVRILRLTFK